MSHLPALLAFVLVAPALADTVTIGRGAYRTDLPPGPDGKERRSVEAAPLVSDRVTGPAPTSDWCSSLVWPMHSAHSLPMFPHPLAVQAFGDGLGIGYTGEPVLSDHLHEGVVFQRGTGYRYPFRQSLRVGLEGMTAESTLLDGFSDWAVTALWKNKSDELRATFAHGSPFVFFDKKSDRPLEIKFTAAKADPHREPVDPYVFEWNGITARHTGEAASIELAINAGKNIGIGSKARLVYDFDGDDKTDRVETFQLFASDPNPESWETYSSANQKLDEALTRGEKKDFTNGSVRFEFWKCFGKGSVELNLADCTISLPFAKGSGKTPRTAGAEEITEVGGSNKAAGAASVFYSDGSTLGVSLNGSHFALFAPTGTKWEVKAGDTCDALVSDLAGKGYFSAAVLPDAKLATVEWFRKFAYAFLRDTRIEFDYDPDTALVTTTYSATTEAMEGTASQTVFSLYRHQHLHAVESRIFQPFTFASPRGEMMVLAGSSFATSIPYLGVLPALPVNPGDQDTLLAELRKDVALITKRKNPFERTDTYWNGKEFGKFSELIQIAEQLGEHAIRDRLLNLLKSRLADWFDAKEDLFFYYDKRWATLTGYPDSYGSGEQLNDHHFHYSYFIKAAATIAQFDPDWVKPENYGGMIDLLIRDCANYDRGDRRFPWMRNLDPYAGHSWAAGHAGFASGNNQESSSESMGFATALILYGQVTGQDEIRDLGIYWHSTEAEAIRHYWFDLDGEVFPDGFEHTCVGMIWGDGGTYGTWWTANPEEIHGINYLPLNGGSLHLGRDPDYVLRNITNLRSSNRNFHNGGFVGNPDKLDRWQDLIFGYLALAEPEDAPSLHSKLGPGHESEFGETRTHTLQWIGALRALGSYDAGIRANHPTAAAFRKSKTITYVVFNHTSTPLLVRFSNGVTVTAPPGLSSSPR